MNKFINLCRCVVAQLVGHAAKGLDHKFEVVRHPLLHVVDESLIGKSVVRTIDFGAIKVVGIMLQVLVGLKALGIVDSLPVLVAVARRPHVNQF